MERCSHVAADDARSFSDDRNEAPHATTVLCHAVANESVCFVFEQFAGVDGLHIASCAIVAMEAQPNAPNNVRGNETTI